jgi:parallel beta-helix repeat protein
MRSGSLKRKRPRSMLLKAVFATCGLLLAAGALSLAIETLDVPPRTLARFVERRAVGHNSGVLALGKHLGAFLLWLDRADLAPLDRSKLRVGAQTDRPTAPGARHVRMVLVTTVEEATRAIEQAQPGDVLTLAPGTYHFSGTKIAVVRAGTEAGAITVRADRLGTVTLEFDMTEGFLVSEPYWTFENLNIRGSCARHADCEHAFHVVARAHHFVAHNNDISEFNAHFKINGEGVAFPDEGLIEGNSLTNSSVRETESSVTPIDLVGASRWTIRGNWISDFAKAGSNQVSYGAFAKGGGSGNVFERNIVRCENAVPPAPGQRIGISLGGGGTGKEYCRDTRCITEQDDSSIRANLIMSCSDDGIYINRSATSHIEDNTLIDTGGISVRFIESSADVNGNLVDGEIRSRDDGALHLGDNMQTSMTKLYWGWHPVRHMFRDLTPLLWATDPSRRQARGTLSPDLCGAQRPLQPTYGAFEDFSKCLNGRTSTEPPSR